MPVKHRLRRLLCILCLLPLFASAVKARADFDIITASDLHYIAPSLTDGGAYYQRVLENGDSKYMPCIEEITDSFFRAVLEAKPEALLLTGDLTFNGAIISHEALVEKLRAVEAAGIPVLVTTGNHDVYNLNAARYRGDAFTRVPSAATASFASLYADFGLNEALSLAPDSNSYVYPLNASTRVLILDLNTEHDFCGISESDLRWVGEQLREAREAGVHVLAAGHQNLFQHSLFRGGYVISNADRLAALFREYGVPLYLSGHLHIQHIVTADALTEIATSALCSYPCQFAHVCETEGEIRYETRRVEVPGHPQLAEEAAAYMNAHFSGTALMPPTADLAHWPDMAAYLQELNLAYFSGDLRDIAALDPDGSLAALWLEPGDLTALYVGSILELAGQNYNIWGSRSGNY